MSALNYTKAAANRVYEISACLPEHYYGYVYLTIIVDRGAYYIGQHKGKFNPAYIDYVGSGKRLLRYIAKNGRDNIRVICLGTAQTKEGLDEMEKRFIGDKYMTDPNCWNLRAGGDTPAFSEETRRRISASLTGKKHSAETRAKLSAAWDYSKHITLERNAKISAYQKGRPGRPLTEEQKNHLRQMNIARAASLSEEERRARSERISAALMGHKGYMTGKHWFTNGQENKVGFECPEGFWPGKTILKKRGTIVCQK